MGIEKRGQKTSGNISSPLFCSNLMCPLCGRERTVNRIADTLQILQSREEDHGQHCRTYKHDGMSFIAQGNCTCLSVITVHV